jgi:hypothetical protein
VARDRFLTRFPKAEDDLIRYYADIGRYVLDRWQAEELERDEGRPLDEAKTDCRWDECSEKHLRDLSTEVGIAYQQHLRRARVAALVGTWWADFKPVHGAIKFLVWVISEGVRGFVGAVGILVIGLIILNMAPSIGKAVRSALDDAFPAETVQGNDVFQPEASLPTDDTTRQDGPRLPANTTGM